jgi:cytochrome c oxidase subunit 3
MSSPTHAPTAPAPHAAHADAHGHAAHAPHLAHHFDTEEQQFDAGKFGIWLFLVTEVLFFSGLFCAYSIWRSEHPEIFLYSHHYLSTFWGAFNTCVLLVSSLTAAWAVRCAQLGNRSGTLWMLGLTILGAFGFLGVKTVEYSAKISHGTLFGKFYHPHATHQIVTAENYSVLLGTAGGLAEGRIAALDEAGRAALEAEARAAAVDRALAAAVAEQGVADVASLPEEVRAEVTREVNEELTADHAAHAHGFHSHEGESGGHASFHGSELEHEMLELEAHRVLAEHEPEPRAVRTFFSIYFAMTGLHGIHVVAGIIALAWVFFRARRGDFNPKYYGAVDYTALYWHLVDLIWIYLFPLLYLIH